MKAKWAHGILKHDLGNCKNPKKFNVEEAAKGDESLNDDKDSDGNEVIDQDNVVFQDEDVSNPEQHISEVMTKFEPKDDEAMMQISEEVEVFKPEETSSVKREMSDDPYGLMLTNQNHSEESIKPSPDQSELFTPSIAQSTASLREELEAAILGEESKTIQEANGQAEVNVIKEASTNPGCFMPKGSKYEDCSKCLMIVKKNSHSKRNHNVPCSVDGCPYMFVKIQDSLLHLLRYHNCHDSDPSLDLYKSCPTCAELFEKKKHEKSYITHMKLDKMHIHCPHCGLAFPGHESGNHEHHVTWSHSNEDNQCPHCDMKFVKTDTVRFQAHLSKPHDVQCRHDQLRFVTRNVCQASPRGPRRQQ